METNPKSKIAQNITGLLLCAGLSGRMGTLKALMLYNGLPFAAQIIKKLFLVCKEVVVVIGHESEKVKAEIKTHLDRDENSKVMFVLNENYKDGMFSSLQCGLRNISKSDWILYHFVDQPSLPVSFYNQFVEQLSEEINWVQPSYKNKFGHPILFNHNVTDKILQLSENNSLRDLSNDQRIPKQIWNCSYAEVLDDIDTIEQFNHLTMQTDERNKSWAFIKNHIEKDGTVILMVVVDSEYSSPGRAGFKMAVSKNKDMVGSIGGGKMEHNLVDEAVENLKNGKKVFSLKKLYHQGDSREDSSGMICSGAQTIFAITLGNENLPTIEKVIQSVESNKKSTIRFDPSGLSYHENDLIQKRIAFEFADKQNWKYQENITQQDTIYIIGGGHVGSALSKVMSLLGFYIVLLDNRPSLQTMELNQFADEKKVINYDDIEKYLEEGDHTYIAIVSHTHQTDKFTLQKVMNKNFKYIGMMGSKSKVKNVMDELRQLGCSEEKLKNIHSPIGIEIQSETPEEIAISIAAEIIKIRNS